LENNNPFILLRKALHTPRDRFFKYRILQGDIFCNERMNRFGMTNSPNCTFCGLSNSYVIENIDHLLWECPRTKGAWDYLNEICRRAYNKNYINYNTVVLGSTQPILVIETLIVKVLRLVMAIDRSAVITNDVIKNSIKQQFIIEKFVMKNQHQKFHDRWHRLEGLLSLGGN